MSQFNPLKLSVKIIPPATETVPIHGRKYTLTHSDITGDLFLSIGYEYDVSTIDSNMRDEVIAEWLLGAYQVAALFGSVYVNGGEFTEEVTKKRFTIFQKEMETALQGIVNGDRQLFHSYPMLLHAPIYIYYQSIFPAFSGLYYYGTPSRYVVSFAEQS